MSTLKITIYILFAFVCANGHALASDKEYIFHSVEKCLLYFTIANDSERASKKGIINLKSVSGIYGGEKSITLLFSSGPGKLSNTNLQINTEIEKAFKQCVE